jgi:hypothetical protein
MFLSTPLLTTAERDAAFGAVPELDQLRLNRNVAMNLVDKLHIGLIDAMVGGFAREALAAFLDGSHLLLRAAGQVAESMAAELYCARADPRGWLPVPDPIDDQEKQALKKSLAQIPLETAAMLLDASLNHFSNAVIRFAWEAGFPESQVATLGLNAREPATKTTDWTTWGRVASRLDELEANQAATARFVLARALVDCYRDPDVGAVSQFRHQLVHRGFPRDLSGPALSRSTGYAEGQIRLTWPVPDEPAPARVAETRNALVRALAPARKLQDTVIGFLPTWAEHVGFGIKIDGKDVTLSFSADPSPIRIAPKVVHQPGVGTHLTLQQYARMNIRRRDQRNHALFEVTSPD